jgi:6-aminohexanoate-oligomer endohydrolase
MLNFEFPGLRVGVAEYGDGPTGVTVFHFPDRVKAAVDVRGGLPATYNLDMLRLGYDEPVLDAICVAGGSWYGLQAVSGVAAALKKSGARSGLITNLANVAGAAVYDFGDRRLNEIHPDAALGEAALASAREGTFPLGARGAGRMTLAGLFYGIPMHSGQGAAFRQIGAARIAAFVIANPVGLIVDRNGRIVSGGQPLPASISRIADALAMLPLPRDNLGFVMPAATSPTSALPNTTIGLVLTDRKLNFAELQRVAYQVHASMGRAIQPFATIWDGDVLFAASTDQVEDSSLHPVDLATIAGEVMWDALLTVFTPGPTSPLDLVPADHIGVIDARFCFDADSLVQLRSAAHRYVLEVAGARPVFGLPLGRRLDATLLPDGRLVFAGGPLALLRDGALLADERGAIDRLVLNLGPWQQIGRREPP